VNVVLFSAVIEGDRVLVVAATGGKGPGPELALGVAATAEKGAGSEMSLGAPA